MFWWNFLVKSLSKSNYRTRYSGYLVFFCSSCCGRCSCGCCCLGSWWFGCCCSSILTTVAQLHIFIISLDNLSDPVLIRWKSGVDSWEMMKVMKWLSWSMNLDNSSPQHNLLQTYLSQFEWTFNKMNKNFNFIQFAFHFPLRTKALLHLHDINPFLFLFQHRSFDCSYMHRKLINKLMNKSCKILTNYPVCQDHPNACHSKSCWPQSQHWINSLEMSGYQL